MLKFVTVLFLGATLMGASCEKKDGAEGESKVGDFLCKQAIKGLMGGAESIANTFACSNKVAIAADLQEPLSKLGLCKESTQQGMLGDLVCPAVGKYIVNQGVNQLPKEWGCTGGPAAAVAEAQLATSCKAAVPY